MLLQAPDCSLYDASLIDGSGLLLAWERYKAGGGSKRGASLVHRCSIALVAKTHTHQNTHPHTHASKIPAYQHLAGREAPEEYKYLCVHG